MRFLIPFSTIFLDTSQSAWQQRNGSLFLKVGLNGVVHFRCSRSANCSNFLSQRSIESFAHARFIESRIIYSRNTRDCWNLRCSSTSFSHDSTTSFQHDANFAWRLRKIGAWRTELVTSSCVISIWLFYRQFFRSSTQEVKFGSLRILIFHSIASIVSIFSLLLL